MYEEVSSASRQNLIFNHLVYHTPISDQPSFFEDAHNEYEILFFLRGDATYIIEDKHYKLRRHDLVIIRPSKYHYIQIDGDTDYERYNLLIPNALIGDLLHQLPSELEVINCDENEQICHLFSKMDAYISFGEDAFFDILHGAIRELFYILLHTRDDTTSPTAHVSPIVQQSLIYINEHLYTIEDIEEISSALFVTETYFFRIFKEQMHISPKKYITSKRLLAAQKQIAAGKRPTEVYLKCGFHTYTAFYKRYLDFFGHSPSEELET